jgi:hypothetical protein
VSGVTVGEADGLQVVDDLCLDRLRVTDSVDGALNLANASRIGLFASRFVGSIAIGRSKKLSILNVEIRVVGMTYSCAVRVSERRLARWRGRVKRALT